VTPAKRSWLVFAYCLTSHRLIKVKEIQKARYCGFELPSALQGRFLLSSMAGLGGGFCGTFCVY
jgi:hypothetical protein